VRSGAESDPDVVLDKMDGLYTAGHYDGLAGDPAPISRREKRFHAKIATCSRA